MALIKDIYYIIFQYLPLKDTKIDELKLVNCKSLTNIPVFTNVGTLIINRCLYAIQIYK